MPVRRHHSKSRYGCTQCKGRKLKCDEIKPKCGNCSKRNLDCSLETEEGSSIIFLEGFKPRSKSPNTQAKRLSPAPTSSPGHSVTPVLGSPSSSSNRTLSVDDGRQNASSSSQLDPSYPSAMMGDGLLLVNHFRASVWKTLVGEDSEPKRAALWLNHVYGLSQHYDFVQHGILAVTALHLGLTDPDGVSQHEAAAQNHHLAAIRSSQPYMQDLRPNMVPSLFVLSILMATYAFGRPKLHPQTMQPIRDAHEILVLLRGPSAIAQNAEKTIEDGPLTGLGLPRLQDPDTSLPVETEKALNELIALNESTVLDVSARKEYQEAIGSLWFTFLLLQEKPTFQLAVLPFAVLTPAEVLQQIKDEQPLALVILAHYAVALHYLNSNVWQRGWGHLIVNAVSQRLDDQWNHYLAWPKRETSRPIQIHY